MWGFSGGLVAHWQYFQSRVYGALAHYVILAKRVGAFGRGLLDGCLQRFLGTTTLKNDRTMRVYVLSNPFLLLLIDLMLDAIL